MATLVLGAVGGLVGGRIGGAIGSLIGQRIDQGLFGGKGRQGPRLNDLSVQTSSYGSAIPKLFGTMRVSGTVIWSTDLRETRRKQSNGKGQPKTTVYSYSASFAVALSARPAIRIGRIWADGKLLRGAAGDFKTPTGFRFHSGSEGQPVDPLIAASEGPQGAPAYRGMAYAVFEDFQLAEYGNRIPSLSFEVIADEGPVQVGAILSQLAGDGLVAATTASIHGFAASGDSVRSVGEVLVEAIPIILQDDGTVLWVRESGLAVSDVPDRALGANSGTARPAKVEIERRSALLLPERLAIAHFDPARDFQPGLQTARRESDGRRIERIDLPAALSSSEAKVVAETRLSGIWAEGVTARIRLPLSQLAIHAGDRVTVPGLPGTWRVSHTSLRDNIVEARLSRFAASATGSAASPGRLVSEADLLHGPSRLTILDLPATGDAAATVPNLFVAAAGALPGWRRAALLTSIDGGASWQDAGGTAAPAIIGQAIDSLGVGAFALIDRHNQVTVELLHNGMQLHDATIETLLAGANVAMLGSELIQFGRAEPIGNNRWQLRDLLRGRRGTEAAIATHLPGESFALIEEEALTPLAGIPAGAMLRVAATGTNDGDGAAEGQLFVQGRALAPLSPKHPRVRQLGNGDTEIGWTRRSRTGWAWRDFIDSPLSEESERYAVTLNPQAGASRSYETSAPHLLYPAADKASDVASGATSLAIAIRQTGTFAVSPPLEFTIPL